MSCSTGRAINCTHLAEATVKEYIDEDSEFFIGTGHIYGSNSTIVHIDEQRYTCTECFKIMHYTTDDQANRTL